MTQSTLSFAFLALTLMACADPSDLGVTELASETTTIDPETMEALYYGINPPRHAEKAYLRVEDSGTLVVLATTIYNRPPFGRVAELSLVGRDGQELAHLAVTTPGRVDLDGLAPGTEVLIRPETIGTMVKLLTPEQIAGASE